MFALHTHPMNQWRVLRAIKPVGVRGEVNDR